MVTGDKSPKGSYILKDTFNTLRLVADCCLGADLLEGRGRLSVEEFHFKPKVFTILFV